MYFYCTVKFDFWQGVWWGFGLKAFRGFPVGFILRIYTINFFPSPLPEPIHTWSRGFSMRWRLVETRAWVWVGFGESPLSSRPSVASGEISCHLYIANMVWESVWFYIKNLYYKNFPSPLPEPIHSWSRGFSMRWRLVETRAWVWVGFGEFRWL